ncbi:MAG: biliverdin-producing heme oxygenase [Phycisphaerales bacterium]|nr:biliverdin-producing heme oxygenase [Phycisphaerales bacterium]
MDRLKTETRPHHDQAEGGGFGTAMMSMTLPLSTYKVHIAAHREIHRAIEDAHSESASELIGRVWHDGLRKVPLLDRDLEALNHGVDEMPEEVQETVGRFRAMVERRAAEDHESLAGVLYVLEGSTMGGTILRKKIAEGLGLSAGAGLDYYSVYGNDVMKHFMDFKGRMIEAYDGSEHEDAIVEAAKETFDLVGEVLRSIPLEPVAAAGDPTE